MRSLSAPNLAADLIASIWFMIIFPGMPRVFLRIAIIESADISVNIAVSAQPRDKNSSPNAPLPAKASQTVNAECGMWNVELIVLNNAIRARFWVGRALCGRCSFRPRNVPEIICKFESMPS